MIIQKCKTIQMPINMKWRINWEIKTIDDDENLRGIIKINKLVNMLNKNVSKLNQEHKLSMYIILFMLCFRQSNLIYNVI